MKKRIFLFCFRHRLPVLMLALLLLVMGWGLFLRTSLTTDVAALLPDRGSRAVADFHRLARAPLARRVVLRLRAGKGVSQTLLLATADRIAARLKPPRFSRVVSGPEGDPARLFSFALEQWPNLLRSEDYKQIRERLIPERIEVALHKVYDGLLQPTGFLQKKMLLADPLDFRALMLPRLISLNPLGRARLVDGHFVSADGRETMLLLETLVAITDFKGAQALLVELNQVLTTEVPEGISAIVLSGHRYTVANATAIQRDMVVVIGASLFFLALIFLIFMRERRALLVFLLPVLVLGPALALTGLIDGSVSAITIGFGAVLLGVAIDYGLHLYFALKTGTQPRLQTLSELTPPLIGAALTTVGAFSAQLFSALPGQRQLALFAIFGIVLALALALLVLPGFLGFDAEPAVEVKTPHRSRYPRVIIGIWFLAMLLLLVSAFRVNCVGDLRRINLVPETLQQAEKSLESVWGRVRGRALVFAEGKNLEEALAVNEKIYQVLRNEFKADEIVSLAPVLPSIRSQSLNRQRWQKFWSVERREKLRTNLMRAGRKIGFSATAFTPFVASLEVMPPFLTENYWCELGFGSLFEAMIESKPGRGSTILSLVPDGKVLAGLRAECAAIPGAHLVSPGLFNDEVGQAISYDLRRFVLLALIIVSLILLVLLRNLYQSLLALLPVLAGLLSMFGIMGISGISFNLFNLVAAILIIGLGVDYGIFMVYRLLRGSDQATEKAVLVSALTTLAGFGVLVLARHPALHSIGLTVLLGVGGALPTVLWVLPALVALRQGEK